MNVGQLQLFVRFCNVAGLFPFRMVVDGETGKFKRFDYHWRHPANVWFAIVFIGQFSFTIFIICGSWKFFIASNSLVYRLSIVMDNCSFFIVSWAPRLLLFHFGKVQNMFNYLIYFDRMLAKYHQNHFNIRRRIIIYIIKSLIMVYCFSKNILLFALKEIILYVCLLLSFVDRDHQLDI